MLLGIDDIFDHLGKSTGKMKNVQIDYPDKPIASSSRPNKMKGATTDLAFGKSVWTGVKHSTSNSPICAKAGDQGSCLPTTGLAQS